MHIVETNLLSGRRYSQPVRDQRLRHDKKEELYFVDPYSNQLTVVQGKEDSVDIPAEYHGLLKDSWTTHNHPNNSTPSIQDFITSAFANEKGFRVLTPDATYIVERTENNWHWKLILGHFTTITAKEWLDAFKFLFTGGKHGKTINVNVDKHPFGVDVSRREDELIKEKSYNRVWDARAEALAELAEKYGYKFTRIENPSNILLKEALELTRQEKYEESDRLFNQAERGDPYNYYVPLMKAIDYRYRGGVAQINGEEASSKSYSRQAINLYKTALKKAKASNFGAEDRPVVESIEQAISDLEYEIWS